MRRRPPGSGRRRGGQVAIWRVVLGAWVALLTCAHASAQPTTRRDAVLRAREEKAQSLHAPERDRVEEGVRYVEDHRLLDRVFAPPSGWFLLVGGANEGNGLTLGGGHRLATPVGTISLQAAASLRRSYVTRIDLTRPLTDDEDVVLTVSAARRHDAVQRFYGPGPDTDLSDRTSFGQTTTEGEAGLRARVRRWLSVGGGVAYVAPDVMRPSEASRTPGPGDRFTDDAVPGLRVQPDFLVARASVVADSRQGTARRGGILYLADVRRWEDRDGRTFDFVDARVDLQHFLSFWSGSRVIAVRALAEHADGLGVGVVPFYLQPTIGGARTLRGYERQRFRDSRLAYVSAEYRVELNPFVSLVAFADAGQVAPRWEAMRWRDVRTSYGAGARVGYGPAVALRAEVAFGGEAAARLIVGFSSSF